MTEKYSPPDASARAASLMRQCYVLTMMLMMVSYALFRGSRMIDESGSVQWCRVG